MKTLFHSLIFFAIAVILFSGCHFLNPSLMLKTKKDFKYSPFPTAAPTAYKIGANDVIRFKVYSNDGFKLIDMTALSGAIGMGATGGGANTSSVGGGLEYKIEFDGTAKLPILGRVHLQGMTVREAETFLEGKYSAFYNKPYVLMEVTSKRVIIFPGSSGKAQVLPLIYENTTLMEALGMAGGIAEIGKAYKIKLIRGDSKNPEVYLIDLSTINGLQQANLVLQANDIIYVEPLIRFDKDVINQILPYLTFFTTAYLFIVFVNKIK